MTIPRLNLSRTNQPGQVYQGSVSQAGSSFGALANLGAQIADTGAQVGQVVERRRQEEARDIVSKETATDKLISKSERLELETQFQDNPKGFAQALTKMQSKRREKVLKSVENPLARERLQQEFEFSTLENNLEANAYERNQFIKVSKGNIESNSKLKAQADFEAPPIPREFVLDLDMDLEDINGRDFSEEEKTLLKQNTVETRVNGVISGMIRGGQYRDYQRASEMVDALGDRITPEHNMKLKRKIESEQIRAQNVKLFKERQEKKIMEREFQQEQRRFRDIFTAVSEDPDADVTNALKLMSNSGLTSVKNPVVLSEAKMDDAQKEQSFDLKYGMLEQLADSDNPMVIRDKLNQAVLSGQMSAEDGQEVLNSIQVRTDSTFRRREYKYADNLLKNSVTRGFSFNKTVEREKLNQMIRERDRIVSEFGIDPASASNIVLKENGKLNLPGMPKVRGVKGDQNTIDGINEAKKQIVLKYQQGTISPDEAKKSIDILERRTEALQDVPTLKELREARQ